MGYVWQDWALAALALTGIEPHEVMQVLTSGRRRPRKAVSSDTGVTAVAVQGRTADGRALLVAVHRIDAWDSLIIGARDLTPAELAEFEEWEAGR